jgi:hypothetical protein
MSVATVRKRSTAFSFGSARDSLSEPGRGAIRVEQLSRLCLTGRHAAPVAPPDASIGRSLDLEMNLRLLFVQLSEDDALPQS